MIHTCDKCSLTFDDVVPWIKHKKICMGSSKKDVGVQVNLCECESAGGTDTPHHIVKQNIDERPQVAWPSADVKQNIDVNQRTCTISKVTKPLDCFNKNRYKCRICYNTKFKCPMCNDLITTSNKSRHMKTKHKNL